MMASTLFSQKEKRKRKKRKMTGDGLHVVRHDGFHTLLQHAFVMRHPACS
jgi:hypothetical protein